VVSFRWCTTAIQIRTGIVLYGFFHIIQGDGSGAVLVVEGENQLVIIQVDGVHKGIDQLFAVGLLAHIQLAVFSSRIVFLLWIQLSENFVVKCPSHYQA